MLATAYTYRRPLLSFLDDRDSGHGTHLRSSRLRSRFVSYSKEDNERKAISLHVTWAAQPSS